MAETHIQWSQRVWNPTTGCDKVSPGCGLPRPGSDDEQTGNTGGCYALTMAKRLKGMGQAKYQNDGDPRTSGPGFKLTLHPHVLGLPLKWRKPSKIFVNSMSDLFHKDVPEEFIARVFATMALTPQHTYQLLTKRHAPARSFFTNPPRDHDGDLEHGVGWLAGAGAKWMVSDALEDLGNTADIRLTEEQWALAEWPAGRLEWPLPNVHVGVSVEDQHWADIRIPALLESPVAVRWISAEPLVGPVNLRPYLASETRLDWVVVGGESGPGARECELDWVRTIVQDCRDFDVPVFVKQLGSVWAQDWCIGGQSVAAHGDPKAGDPEYWPTDLQVREFPQPAEVRHG